MVEQNFPSQELRSEFVRQVPELFSQRDVFSDCLTIVHMCAMEFKLAATNEAHQGLVRAEYRYDDETGQFRLFDVNEIMGAFKDGVLQSSALFEIRF